MISGQQRSSSSLTFGDAENMSHHIKKMGNISTSEGVRPDGSICSSVPRVLVLQKITTFSTICLQPGGLWGDAEGGKATGRLFVKSKAHLSPATGRRMVSESGEGLLIRVSRALCGQQLSGKSSGLSELHTLWWTNAEEVDRAGCDQRRPHHTHSSNLVWEH